MLSQMLDSDPSNTLIRRNKAVMTNWLGRDLRSSGRSDLAIAAHREALAASERLAAADPNSGEHKQDFAFAHFLIAEVLGDLKSDREALTHYDIAARSEEKLRIAEPTNSRHADDLALIYSGMGKILTRTRVFPDARSAVAKAITLSEAAAARNPANLKARVNLAATYFNAGSLEESTGRWSDARQHFRKSADIFNRIAAERRLSAAQNQALLNATRELRVADSALAGAVH
jgi:tetratricopeptide (TPR) repeat protein